MPPNLPAGTLNTLANKSLSSISSITDFDSRLAVELAIQIVPVADLLARYELSKADLRRKLANPTFKQMIRDAKRVWNSDLSVKERIRLKSQVLIEDSILAVYEILHDTEIVAASRLDAFKQLARVADVEQPDKSAAGDLTGSRFAINLIFGDKPPLAIAGTATHVSSPDLED